MENVNPFGEFYPSEEKKEDKSFQPFFLTTSSFASLRMSSAVPLKELSDNREDKPDFPEWIKSKPGEDCMQWPVSDRHYLYNRLFWAFDAGRDRIWDQYLKMKDKAEKAEARIKELEALLDKCAKFAASTPTYPGKRELQLEVLSILAEKIKAHD